MYLVLSTLTSSPISLVAATKAAGLLYKIKTLFPDSIYKTLKSYLENRFFLIKYRAKYTYLHPILSGVPQGISLAPLLFLLYSADLLRPTAQYHVATFADDTAFLTTHEDPAAATHKLQIHLNKIQLWLKKWRTNANETKSVQVTFTLKQNTRLPAELNNKQLTQTEEVKYLGIHLDRTLT